MEGQSRKELMTILLFCMYRVDFILTIKKLQSIYKVCYVLLFKSLITLLVIQLIFLYNVLKSISTLSTLYKK